MNRRFALYSILCFLSAIIIDQATKFIAIKKIPESGIFLCKSYLTVKMETVQNSLATFSLNIGNSILIVIIVLILLVLGYTVYRLLLKKQNFSALTVSLVVGAAFSNLIDRVLRGAVVDFISLSIADKTWPTFNAADIIISLCSLFLIILILRKPKQI